MKLNYLGKDTAGRLINYVVGSGVELPGGLALTIGLADDKAALLMEAFVPGDPNVGTNNRYLYLVLGEEDLGEVIGTALSAITKKPEMLKAMAAVDE